MALKRGCGTRIKGGCYWELECSPYGAPVETFLLDPPIPVPENVRLSAIGVKIFQRNGLWHILDHVGSTRYPNVQDFVEEVRLLGLSRRLPSTLDFSKITVGSRIILAHSRACVENPEEYPERYCPKGIEEHKEPAQMCAGIWMEDVEDGASSMKDPPVDYRWVLRNMPSFQYAARHRPEGASPQYVEAFFASFPASRLVVVRDPDGGHVDALEKARGTKIPVEVVDS